MRYFVTIGERTLEVELGPNGVEVDGVGVDADLVEMDGTEVRNLILDGRSHRVLARRGEKGVWGLHLSGTHLEARVVDQRTRVIEEMTGAGEAASGPTAMKAPMPGLVVRVEAEAGQMVAAGDGIIIVEAMKMENELKCQGDARVRVVHVKEGDTVDKDQLLVEFDPLDPPPAQEAEE